MAIAPFGQWSMMNFWFGRCARVVGVPFGRWSVFCIFTVRWPVFIFENGWWLVAYGQWFVVDGWSWAVVLDYAVILRRHKELLWLWI